MSLYLFSKKGIPDTIPEEMQKIVDDLKKSSGQDECLHRVYWILSEKYRGYRAKTYVRFFEVFASDPKKLWQRNGFMHCTNINYLLRILLVGSGFFKEDNIRLKWTQVWFVSPHQYAQVKIGEKWIDVDIWARPYGIELGDHAHGWH
jgi:hypothetical protein